jgi:hypothetical protein
MSVAADTVAALNAITAGTLIPPTATPFKARLAIKVAHQQIAGGAVNISQQPTLYAAIIARAVLNESNR